MGCCCGQCWCTMILVVMSCERIIFNADLGSFCCILCCGGWLGGSDSVESIGVLKVSCLGCCLFNVVRKSNVAVAA